MAFKLNQTDIILILASLVLLITAIFYLRNLVKTRKNKDNYFANKWQEIQKMLCDDAKWNEAIIQADCLLDECLKQHHYKGRTMGERLVAAQRQLVNNDLVWFSHKLKNKIVNDGLAPTKTETKKSLLGVWSALRDLGAFKTREL